MQVCFDKATQRVYGRLYNRTKLAYCDGDLDLIQDSSRHFVQTHLLIVVYVFQSYLEGIDIPFLSCLSSIFSAS